MEPPVSSADLIETMLRAVYAGEELERAIIALNDLRERSEDRAELEHVFDTRWRADMRAIKRWQNAGPGRELTWPDHADMVVWLIEQLEGNA